MSVAEFLLLFHCHSVGTNVKLQFKKCLAENRHCLNNKFLLHRLVITQLSLKSNKITMFREGTCNTFQICLENPHHSHSSQIHQQ